MISGVRGRIVEKVTGAVLVDVHGIILRVLTSQTTLADLPESGADVELATHLYVREDQLTLFGFASPEELQLFELLMTVSGIGPKVALGILSAAKPEAIHEAIANEDLVMLGRLPGVGKKTAQRIIFDLRGKLPEPVAAGGTRLSGTDNEALEALQALGYSPMEAREALARLGHREGQTVEERIFAALQSLAHP